jgi:hypothetical protein
MKTKTALLGLGVALIVSAAPALASTPSTTTPPATPNSCIELNHGDANACNVGNSGAGNLPYKPVVTPPATPNTCIELNHGDANACNVGNSGAGNLPYKPVVSPEADAVTTR